MKQKSESKTVVSSFCIHNKARYPEPSFDVASEECMNEILDRYFCQIIAKAFAFNIENGIPIQNFYGNKNDYSFEISQ